MDQEVSNALLWLAGTVLTFLGGQKTGKTQERIAQARLPVDQVEAEAKVVEAEAGQTEASAHLLEAQTAQHALLWQQISSLTTRLDLEMKGSATMREDIFAMRLSAAHDQKSKDARIDELLGTVDRLSKELARAETRIRELESHSVRPLTLLMIDDSLDDVALFRMAAQGHHVESCANSAEALERLGQPHCFDVILCDINLGAGSLDGVTLATTIRQVSGCEKTILVAMTGTSPAQLDADSLLTAGFNGIVFKPSDGNYSEPVDKIRTYTKDKKEQP